MQLIHDSGPVEDDEECDNLLKPTRCPPLYDLEELEIVGYLVRTDDVQLITCLIKNVFSLEKIIINHCVYV